MHVSQWYPGYIEKYREAELARELLRAALRKLEELLDNDVVVVGAGPAGLTLSWLLASKGLRVTVVEQTLGLGGGMRGGAALLPAGLVEEGEAASLLREAGVGLRETRLRGIYAIDPVEAATKLAARAISAGARFLVGVYVEDLIIREQGAERRVGGVVVNLRPVVEAGWHIDPWFIEARATVDATGHDAWLVKLLERRVPGSVKPKGMSSLDVWRGERLVVEKTGEVFPGLYLAGMSVAETHNLPRMGPIFGGMIASAIRLSEILEKRLTDKEVEIHG